ncbi:MAG: hypothetical protein JO353_04830, partial [Phycisphaerae bacterium]|nr:hypothetical protein [Phycisphaerae bacterium]
TLTETFGLQFLADERGTQNTYTSQKVTAYIASFKEVQTVLQKSAGLANESAHKLEIHELDESGVNLTLGKTRYRPKLILLAGSLPPEQGQQLGLPTNWDAEVLHQYTFTKLKPAKPALSGGNPNPIIPMSLDLGGSLNWAWMLATGSCTQLAVESPNLQASDPVRSLQHWADVLANQDVLKGVKIDPSAVISIELPFAGALAQDLVANRTLLFGPAGGFYTACGEDIYPCCWSATFAVAAAKAALKEKFLQDALQQYRQKWGATLGDYLRGPQQNLKFLLPLVYRNATMAARLAEAILTGESVVR